MTVPRQQHVCYSGEDFFCGTAGTVKEVSMANVQGIVIILVILGIAIKWSPKGVSIAGHDAGQLFLLAALPLFFIDFGTSAEYAAGELHHILAESNLQSYAPIADLA